MATNDDVSDPHVAQQELRDSERRFRLAMEHAPIGMVLTDLDGNWLRTNHAMRTFLGRSSAELAGRVVDRVSHPDDLARSEAEIARLLAGEANSYALEKRYLHADGSLRWGHVTATLARDDEGTPLYVIGQVVDITARKQAEAALQGTIEELERSNTHLEGYASIVSHDLRAPLATLIGLLDLVVRHSPLPPDSPAAGWLVRARRQAEQLADTVDALRLLASVSRTPFHRATVDVRVLVAEVLESLAPVLREAGAEVHIGDLAPVDADRAQLRLLIQNLVANAATFRDGTRPLHVSIEATATDETWTLTVRDNGVGFEPAERERIFQLFARSTEGERFEGSGIGLATCRRVAERHGGSITAVGTPGIGATFRVQLPHPWRDG